MAEKNDPFSRNDDFWDIEAMLPKKKSRTVFSSDTSLAEITVNQESTKSQEHPIPAPRENDRLRLAKEALKKAEEKHHAYTAAAFADRKVMSGIPQKEEKESPSDEPLFSYSPEGNALIKQVTVRLWPARYSFYERFRNDALRYYERSASETAAVPFFSYTPQYAQLSKEQLSFYLYWRDRFRSGEIIDADYSYLLLFIYEVINLPDSLPPEEGITSLSRLWLAYRKKHPKLDRYLPEWICDYCLIHRLRPPTDLYDASLRSIVNAVSLKEFYLGYDTSSRSPFATALFTSASSYHWRTSKFINEANRHLFETHIRGAVLYALEKAEKEHLTVFAPLGEKSMVTTKATRDAFNGALCAYNIKRRIEIEYLSCSRSIELRYVVTDTVKYAENQLRGILGIRSRFHTPNLAQPLKHAIEEYFAPLKVKSKKEAPAEAPPAYDALYEPIKTELSLSFAKDIEKRSWTTTELLTEDCEEYNEEASPAPTPAPKEDTEKEWLTEAMTYCLANNQQAFAALAAEHNLLPDALCELLNDRLFEVIGDVAVEQGEGGYHAVTEYLEEITQWMKE